MEGDNAYLVEELGQRVPAVKRSAIKVLPTMLCVHLKRFEYDYHHQTRFKVRVHGQARLRRWCANACESCTCGACVCVLCVTRFEVRED